MGHNESADVVVGMPSETPLLILISHCREMKQQEARFRIITLLLLLSCAALFVFINCVDSTHRRAPTASESSPVFSAQQNLCPAESPSTTSTRTTGPSTASPLRVELSFAYESNLSAQSYIKWAPEFGGDNGTYDSDSRAIVIPVTGYYFVYMRFLLHLCGKKNDGGLKKFHVKLQMWSKGYPKDVDLTEARDDEKCSEERFRTVLVGQQFDLFKGDHLKVLIVEGYELIHKSSFGAFWT